ncbi:bacillithiol biosynthesis cysteine-adding enzyme BshC [Paenibacillus sp. GCM10012307]|uniref:Putative cysteine ligase BshC n=1 Tax=Paenibacillus roseus TaxID=2798579 RepID=A0A934MQH3_9BACL|nr:bacillithiol biosynthesis cysteine-adding enzyme BshC [Paenibacillus roseus]MBJ6363146.1 bacillithiol biosynthesis cysteine-adding enzyme BshC [Paenibacillus roseus]
MSGLTLNMPSGQPITDAYINKTDPNVLRQFGYHWQEDGHWAVRAEELRQAGGPRADRAALAEVLSAYNREHGASEAALEHIRELGNGALVVVGGQQAGLWSGPLLVLFKAVSIIQSAAFARDKLKSPVIPVFWIAGEDHDWEEAGHTYLVSEEPKLRKLELTRPKGAKTSVSRSIISPEAWKQAIEELGALLPDSEYKPDLLDRLCAFTDGAATLSDTFARLLAWLFGPYGLVVMDADDPALRRLEAPMFECIVRSNEALQEAYNRSAAYLAEHGYSAQAEVAPDGANLFLFGPGHSGAEDYSGDRQLLFRSGQQFKDRKGFVKLSTDELLELARRQPERLSNNVLTRPLMQDYLFPVLGTVLGPGEIAYWALTSDAFKALGMNMPIVVPRLSFTFVDRTAQKHMERYGMTLDTVMHNAEQHKSDWLSRQGGLQPMDETFDKIKDQLSAMYEPVLETLAPYGQDIQALAETNQSKLFEQLEFMKSRLYYERSKRHDDALRQMERVQLQLWPQGKPQERVLNFIQLWNQSGLHWLRDLLQQSHNNDPGHRVVYL